MTFEYIRTRNLRKRTQNDHIFLKVFENAREINFIRVFWKWLALMIVINKLLLLSAPWSSVKMQEYALKILDWTWSKSILALKVKKEQNCNLKLKNIRKTSLTNQVLCLQLFITIIIKPEIFGLLWTTLKEWSTIKSPLCNANLLC